MKKYIYLTAKDIHANFKKHIAIIICISLLIVGPSKYVDLDKDKI